MELSPYSSITGRHHMYILDEANAPVPVDDVLEWAKQIEGSDRRRVALETLPDGKIVSTVFLGLDYNWLKEGPPLLFETMVFPSGEDYGELDVERYSTWSQAESGHRRLVKKWKKYAAQLDSSDRKGEL